METFFLMIFIEVASYNQNKQSLKLFTIRYLQFHRASPNPMRRQRATSGPPSNYHGKAPFGLFTIPPGSQTLEDAPVSVKSVAMETLNYCYFHRRQKVKFSSHVKSQANAQAYSDDMRQRAINLGGVDKHTILPWIYHYLH
jgi:hypothetical protein